MTRINCIPVERLPRQALVAKYREMLRMRKAYPRDMDSKSYIPSTYRMGLGHLTFFYNKGQYLIDRHCQLRQEMTNRGYVVNYELDLSSWPNEMIGNWKPDVDSKIINVSRIINRTYKG